jgi:hypothetical protein
MNPSGIAKDRLHFASGHDRLSAMIEDTISKIEERLQNEESLSSEKQRELQELLAQLRLEARGLQLPVDEEAKEDARGAINQLEASLTEFETTHPQLVGLVNRISTVLSNMRN